MTYIDCMSNRSSYRHEEPSVDNDVLKSADPITGQHSRQSRLLK